MPDEARPKIPELDQIREQIRDRIGIPDWRRQPPPWGGPFPWWPRPAHVKILLYADGGIRFDGGPFYGLKQVIATLTANHYPWVHFEVTTANRLPDPTADHASVDLAAALALKPFDELWIYSFDAAPQLTGAELAAAQAFTDGHKGGVLITGDHASLGAAFGNLPRAGKMRRLPAPPAAPPDWNSTLRSGADSLFEFEDQSDAYPQPLNLTWYWGGPFWKAPHPVLCSPFGPIDIFPDHEHEGEALAPPAAGPEWPGGVAAEVIARGTIIDPSSNRVGQSIGVLSAYNGHDPAANVGRIVADSTWHHHFDINLRGLGTAGRTGFVNPGTANWLLAAKKIEHYFVNAAIWLAPPAKQAEMRAAAWWPVVWSDQVFESFDLAETHLLLFGRNAYDALGRYAPQCARFAWVWDLVPAPARRDFIKFIDKGDPPPIIEFIAGEATRQLRHEFKVGPHTAPGEKTPSHEEINRVLAKSVGPALQKLGAELSDRSRSFQEFALGVVAARK